MSTAAMSRSRISGAAVREDQARCTQWWHVLRVLPGVARLVKLWFSQEAGGIPAMFEVIYHTPPPVDISTYRNTQNKNVARPENGGNKPKPGEKKPEPKPDKKKPEPKPGRQGDREPREPREPNAKTKETFPLS